MNTDVFFLALSQLILSILLAIIIFFISYKILIRIFKLKEENLNGSNLALSVFFSGIIFSTGYLLSGIIPSIINSIELLKNNTEGSLYVEVLKYSSISLFVGFLLAGVIHFSSFMLTKSLTKHVDEVAELQKNNLAVAILLATILISITIIARDSLVFLIELFLPQPVATEFTA
ncbi:DUF350 domain-containing protein [Kordia sp.]|uniref:DUF350 domain-containing protein n=1 Tax=Kordia sp. TaxID=1965332 RepID=UPI0025BA30A6|nr:DUF350 domain-containing protein [Kordia sp.]MCH2196784.1 DUF350 domain-containing protein [Kordia sp.]